MKNLPQGFISTILAQKKLSGNGNSNNGNNATVSDGLIFNSDLKEYPNFNTPDNSNENEYGMPFSEISVMFARKAKRVYERHLAKDRDCELISKADQYEIPYDSSNVDFIDLRDKIEEFESAIELANQYGIDWKNFGYDLLAIEQEIAESQTAESEYLNYARSEFLCSRAVGA